MHASRYLGDPHTYTSMFAPARETQERCSEGVQMPKTELISQGPSVQLLRA